MTTPWMLLVEDNPRDAEITQRALGCREDTTRLTVVGDGERALELLEDAAQADGLPMLVLLDLNLPRINGIEVLERIRARAELRRLPVVILTTSKRDEDVARCYDLGVNTYITKPIRVEQFLAAMATFRQYWFGVATLPG